MVQKKNKISTFINDKLGKLGPITYLTKSFRYEN